LKVERKKGELPKVLKNKQKEGKRKDEEELLWPEDLAVT